MDYDSVKHILAEMAQRTNGGQFILLTKHDHGGWEVLDLRARAAGAGINAELMAKLAAVIQELEGPAMPKTGNLIDFNDEDEDEDVEDDDQDACEEEAVRLGLDDNSEEDQSGVDTELENLISSCPSPSSKDASSDLSSSNEADLVVPPVPENEFIKALRGIKFLDAPEPDLGDKQLWENGSLDEFDDDVGPGNEHGALFTPLKRTNSLIPVSSGSAHPVRMTRGRAKTITVVEEEESGSEDEKDADQTDDGVDGAEDYAGFVDQGVYALDPKSPQKKTFRTSVESPKSTLLSTTFLDQYDLVWNNKFNTFICKICEQAVCFDQLHPHVTGKTLAITKEWDNGEYKMQKIRHSASTSMGRKAWENRLLSEVGHIRGDIPVPLSTKDTMRLPMKDWANLVKPHAEESGGSIHTPVEGIAIKSHGFVCNASPCCESPFPYAALSKSTMVGHFSASKSGVEHVNRPKSFDKSTLQDVPVQTLMSAQGAELYFRVDLRKSATAQQKLLPSTSTPGPTINALSESDIRGALRKEAKNVFCSAHAGSPSALLHPVFSDMGMTAIWAQFRMEDIYKIHSMRPVGLKKATRQTQLLHVAVTATFMSICESVQKASQVFLGLLTRGGPGQKRRPFSVPQNKGTLKRYLVFEVQLLRHMIYVFNHPIYRKDQSGGSLEQVFKFDSKQSECLRRLTDILRAPTAALQDVVSAVLDTLHSLYFPMSPESASFDTSSNLIVVYISLMCLTPEGSPIKLSHIPVYLAKAQFSMRLRAYHHLYTRFIAGTRDSQPHHHSPNILPKHTSTTAPTPSKIPIPIRTRGASGRPPRHPPRSSTTKPSTRSLPIGHSPASGIPTRPSLTRHSSRLKEKARLPSVRLAHHSDGSDSENDEPGDSDSYRPSQGLQAFGSKVTFDLKEDAMSRTQDKELIDLPQQSEWYQGILAWLDIYVNEEKVSPYASARTMMHMSSVAQRGARKIPFLQWKSPGVLLVDKNALDLSQFVDFVDFQLESLEEYVKQHVLFGSSLDDLGITCDFTKMEDTKDVDTAKYGCLLSDVSEERPLNPDAEKFSFHLAQSQQLYSLDSQGTLHWKTTEAVCWSESLSLALDRLCVLCHILQGSPGRGTEELKMQVSNTTGGGRRHLFIDNHLGTFFLFSNYWKGAKATGRFKEIIRVLPYRPARLLFTLIRVARPIELMYLSKNMTVEEFKTASETSHGLLWASKGKPPRDKLLNDALPAFFQREDRHGSRPFTWITGVRLYRHLVVAIQRRHFHDFRYSKEDEQRGLNIGDLQAGRSGETSEQHYAPEIGSVPAERGMIAHYVQFSQLWHKFMKQSTSFDLEFEYIV